MIMGMFDKVKVAVAAPKKTKKPLFFFNAQTTGFYQLQPIFYHEMIPDCRVVNQKGILFSRSNPFNCPTMQKIDYKVNQFFVRWKDVWPAWDDYFAHAKHVYSDPSYLAPVIPKLKPYILMKDLVLMFLASPFVNSGNSTDYDIVDGSFYYKLTDSGLEALKLLENLGYKLTWDTKDESKVEILTLFAYGKIYLDYYWPRSYAYNLVANYIAQAFTYNGYDVQATNDGLHNTTYYNAVFYILQNCNRSYIQNHPYYNAWDNPVSPNSSNEFAGLAIEDVTNDANNKFTVLGGPNALYSPDVSSSQPSNGTPFVAGPSGSGSGYYARGAMTGFIQKALVKVTDFVRRYALVGERTIDRFLATMGIQLKDNHRAIHLKEDVFTYKIGDVESNATTTNGGVKTYTGDLAGKGVNAGQVKFDYYNDCHAGIFMILQSTITNNFIHQGVDPLRYVVSRDQYYDPEFDGWFPAAVSPREIAVYYDSSKNNAGSTVFGFMPAQYQYILPRTIVTGAFNFDRWGAQSLDGYLNFRRFDQTQDQIVHSLSFGMGNSYDQSQWNRAFYEQTSQEQFILTFDCDYIEISPKKPLYDVYEFEDNEDNKNVIMESQGVELN